MKKQGVILALCVLSCLSVAAADYTTNMVAQWTFEGNTNDSAGSVNNAITLGTGTALENGCLKITGSGTATFDNTGEVAFGTGDSYTVWVRFRAADGNIRANRNFINNTNTTGGMRFRVDDNSSRSLRATSGTGTNVRETRLNISSEDWYEAALVYVYRPSDSTDKITLYLDGTGYDHTGFDKPESDGLATTTIGNNGSDSVTYIEEMRIYSSNLSGDSVRSIEYVPEPASLALLAAGGLGLLVRRKR